MKESSMLFIGGLFFWLAFLALNEHVASLTGVIIMSHSLIMQKLELVYDA